MTHGGMDRWITEWRCAECKTTFARQNAAVRYGLAVCPVCLPRGMIPKLIPTKSEPLLLTGAAS